MAAFREEFSKSKHIVVLTGAGVSAESGVPTFRGAGGLWRKFRAQVVIFDNLLTICVFFVLYLSFTQHHGSSSFFLERTLLLQSRSGIILRLCGNFITTEEKSWPAKILIP